MNRGYLPEEPREDPDRLSIVDTASAMGALYRTYIPPKEPVLTTVTPSLAETALGARYLLETQERPVKRIRSERYESPHQYGAERRMGYNFSEPARFGSGRNRRGRGEDEG